MSDNDFLVEYVSKEVFDDGFKEEAEVEFREFLHSGNSIYYSEDEKNRYRKLKPEFKDEAFLFLVVKYKGQIVARSFSNQIPVNTLMMCMSYVKKEFRGKGLYKLLLDETIKWARENGYIKLTSCHNTTNNKIIIPKLQRGFVITGMKVNAGYGTLVELTYFFNQNEKDAVDFRTGYRKPTQKVTEAMGSFGE